MTRASAKEMAPTCKWHLYSSNCLETVTLYIELATSSFLMGRLEREDQLQI